MSFNNKITDVDIISLSDKDYISFLSRKNKIQEEIKDCVIDRFINKIYQQHKEIQQLKKKLEETIKNSLLIIKRCLLKKKLFPVNQIKLSYSKNSNFNKYDQNCTAKSQTFSSLIKNIRSVEREKHYQRNPKININSFAIFNKISLKKFLGPKLPQNEKNNKVNKLYNYTESFDVSRTCKNNSRNILSKDSTFLYERNCETFFIENKNKIEPINSYTAKRKKNQFSMKQKEENMKKKQTLNLKNGIFQQKSFFDKNVNLGINDKNKAKNRIKLLSKNINASNKNNRNKSRNLNSFNKFNLSNIIINNNNNQNMNNHLLDYCKTERTIKNEERMNDIVLFKKNIFSCSQNNNNININYVNNINQNSLPKNKKNGKQLNKIILKMKDINKNIYPIDLQYINQKTEKFRKKMIMNDINKNNSINYISITDRFLDNKNNDENIIIKDKKEIEKKNKQKYRKQKKENSIKINEYNFNNYKNENSFSSIYNPTFTSFLNRKNEDNYEEI